MKHFLISFPPGESAVYIDAHAAANLRYAKGFAEVFAPVQRRAYARGY